MRVGLVRRGYSGTGGAESYSIRFAHALAQAGHTPVLFTAANWPAGQWPGEIIQLHTTSPAGFDTQVRAARARCDVLFSLERLSACDVYRAGDGVHRAWLERRARYEARWRGCLREINPKHRQLLALESALFRPEHTRHVIANSQMVEREIRELFSYSAISVIYNGLPAESFCLRHDAHSPLRKSLGISPDDCLVFFAGSGWERKGLAFALAACSRAPRAVHLVIAGRGRIPREVPARTHFLGPVRNIAEWLAASDVFILPTIYDPFSNACLEAHAAGLPVITTAANGFAEILQDGHTGSVISQPDGIDALIEALTYWSDPDRREHARPLITAQAAEFTIERNLEQTLQIISDARAT